MPLISLLVQTGATGWERFAVFSVVAFAVFALVLRLSLRTRNSVVWPRILVLGIFVVFGGMLFARLAYGLGLPSWIFYGLPALATFCLPPLLFRMSGCEAATYVAMALFMAPVIHIFFSFFVGWHDYMPLFYVPSLWDLIRGHVDDVQLIEPAHKPDHWYL